MRPRVGHIQFLNCLPLYYGLVKSHALLDIELIKGLPTALNGKLMRGELDISPISSIEYARNAESLVLFPDFTVSSDGPVKSILLVSRFPIEELSGKRVGLTGASATSHVLLKLVLTRGYAVSPEYFVCPPDVNTLSGENDALLLIGDAALHYSVNPENFLVCDLGEEWKKLSGRKMVYAVWALTRSFAGIRPALSGQVFDMFKRSMAYSMEHLSEIAEYAAKWEPFTPEFLMDYFSSLRFDFDASYREGLLHFFHMAAEMGELDRVPQLEFIRSLAAVTP
ncbi:MAG: menaquinone biosynthetic enzyme MqnA/MqnD family protein [Nitrospirota bacterium]